MECGGTRATNQPTRPIAEPTRNVPYCAINQVDVMYICIPNIDVNYDYATTQHRTERKVSVRQRYQETVNCVYQRQTKHKR